MVLQNSAVLARTSQIVRVPSLVICIVALIAFGNTQTNKPNVPNSHGPSEATLFSRISDTATHDMTPAQLKRIKQIENSPTTQTVTLVRLNEDVARKTRFQVSLAETGSMDVNRVGGQTRDSRNFTWLGSVQGDEPGGTTLVAKDGQVLGTISTTRGVFRILPVGGGVHALVKLDVSKFPLDEPPSFNKTKVEHYDLRNPATGSMPRGNGLVQIDVLVAYSPGAESGIVGDINATIQLAVEEANQSYLNSHIKIHLNLVDTLRVDYVEGSKSFETILHDFVAMSDVQQRRDKSHADLAALIINKNDYCGLADAILATSATAFAIVHYDCATGYYSFAHELGHLMGARHNEAVDSTDTPFPYGHGYINDSKWRTIMAYDCRSSCTRLQYWSNPNVSYNGESMGTIGRNNNARVLNETAPAIAAFR